MGLSAWKSNKAQYGVSWGSMPDNTLGYVRGYGDLRYGNQGSGMGANMAGRGTTLNATQSRAGTGKWEPSVLYLLVLILAEVVLMGVLRKATRHGG